MVSPGAEMSPPASENDARARVSPCASTTKGGASVGSVQLRAAHPNPEATLASMTVPGPGQPLVSGSDAVSSAGEMAPSAFASMASGQKSLPSLPAACTMSTSLPAARAAIVRLSWPDWEM